MSTIIFLISKKIAEVVNSKYWFKGRKLKKCYILLYCFIQISSTALQYSNLYFYDLQSTIYNLRFEHDKFFFFQLSVNYIRIHNPFQSCNGHSSPFKLPLTQTTYLK